MAESITHSQPVDDPLAINDAPVLDPPPPYPSRENRRSRRHGHAQFSSTESDGNVYYGPLRATDDESTSEHSPFLPLTTPNAGRNTRRRNRALSHTSSISNASTFAQTVCSLFQDNDEPEQQERLPPLQNNTLAESPGRDMSLSARARRYFRPMTRKVYYDALLHLLVINFPYALLAWVYLFVFTLTGTTLLLVLPVGAVLCFFNLLGARLFARGELALQSRFHHPLAYAPPYPPHPLFIRHREVTQAEAETGRFTPGQMIPEKSFYKNTYALFTDPMSYQALFYFLVIKASITLLLFITLIIATPLCFILVVPAPMFLRAVRSLGIWQAGVAVEGLFVPVRL